MSQNRRAEAIAPFCEAAKIYRQSVVERPADLPAYIGSLYMLSNLYISVGDYRASYESYQELLPLMKAEYETSPEAWRKGYSGSLANQSSLAIMQLHYAEAEQLAREALTVGHTRHVVNTNIAAALLFQGRYEEAEHLYRQYKDEMKDTFLEDFRQFGEAGAIPEERKGDVERIKGMLNE